MIVTDLSQTYIANKWRYNEQEKDIQMLKMRQSNWCKKHTTQEANIVIFLIRKKTERIFQDAILILYMVYNQAVCQYNF